MNSADKLKMHLQLNSFRQILTKERSQEGFLHKSHVNLY